MFQFTSEHRHVLKTYPRPIAHMRAQYHMKRFGLVFGSGLSKSLKLPLWRDLVEKIAADPAVDGSDILASKSQAQSLPYQTELLLQHFKERRAADLDDRKRRSREFEYSTMAEWMKIVAKHLYANAPSDLNSAIDDHPYLKQYLSIIRRIPMTVTYNFDDLLEQSLSATRDINEKPESRGYEAVTNPWAQFRRKDSVIFHPHGIFPRMLVDVPVDKVVFSEASFAEQLMGALAGDQSGLISYFAKNTCLLIGLSLDDEMLRNLLMMIGKANPGNYHYFVHFLK